LAEKFPLGLNFRSFLGKWPPKRVTVSMRLQIGTSLRQTASFEPLSVTVRRADRAVRESKKPEKIQMARLTLYFTHMCGGAFAQPIGITFVVVQELAVLMKCTQFCGDRLRDFCATVGQSLGSPIGKRYDPYHSGKHYRAAVWYLLEVSRWLRFGCRLWVVSLCCLPVIDVHEVESGDACRRLGPFPVFMLYYWHDELHGSPKPLPCDEALS
jgi:hypothetical protein